MGLRTPRHRSPRVRRRGSWCPRELALQRTSDRHETGLAHHGPFQVIQILSGILLHQRRRGSLETDRESVSFPDRPGPRRGPDRGRGCCVDHQSRQTPRAVMPHGLFPYPLLRPGPSTPSRVNRIVRHVFGTISDDVIANRRSTSAASIMPACGMRWILREFDEPPLQRIPVPGRRSRFRSGIARIP